MRQQISILIILLFSINGFSQEDVADYKKFEALAKKINDLQISANGKRLKNETDDIAINVPDNNFIFNYYYTSASLILGNDNQKEIFPNINLASINLIGSGGSTYQSGDANIVVVISNEKVIYNTLKGNENKESSSEFIPLPVVHSKTEELVDALAELILLSKVKSGKLSKKLAKDEFDSWIKAKKENNIDSYYKFLKDYPNTILKEIVGDRAESLDYATKFILSNNNGFYLGMTKNEFGKIIDNRINEYKNNSVKKSKNSMSLLSSFSFFSSYNGTFGLYNLYKSYRIDAKVDATLYENFFSTGKKMNFFCMSSKRKSSLVDALYKTDLSFNKKLKVEKELEYVDFNIGNISSSLLKNS
ncbi:MAG TPA: hypothetical protein DCP54_09455, partial [Chryseobacterium sp.]|nr:hypothetical protein [Chryseobacterium sp.]